MYCDNKAAIAIAHNPVLHDKTKHVEVDKPFIKEKIEKGLICMSYILTAEQIADVLTKGLYKRQFDYLINNYSIQLEGECWKRKENNSAKIRQNPLGYHSGKYLNLVNATK